jgi:hypothetical protein
MKMSQTSLTKDDVQVSFRCTRASADMLAELAKQRGGLRGLILGWLAQAGYADVAQQDLERPDGRRRRQMHPETAHQLAAGLPHPDPADEAEKRSAPCTGFLGLALAWGSHDRHNHPTADTLQPMGDHLQAG